MTELRKIVRRVGTVPVHELELRDVPKPRTEFLFQGLPELNDRWATIKRGTLEDVKAERAAYEAHTGLLWRAYRILREEKQTYLEVTK